ncbi:MAG TPA: glycosyltransferase family 39 protein, partial [Planctomycetaceae bacterium]|nr:glycosyltransferase family 39 protein [Planctomycetaceae bacterium]
MRLTWGQRIWLPVLALWLTVALFGAILCFPVPLLDPDEGLHAAIAQEMVESHDWLTPHLLGQSFLDKPILFFWLQAFSLRTFGMSEGAVRLPGLVCGLLGAITAGWLAGRMFGRATGVFTGFFQATLFLPLALTQAAVHDVALVPWTNLALWCCWEFERRPNLRDGLRWALGIGACLGAAILTKGLIGAVFVLLTWGAASMLEHWRRESHWTIHRRPIEYVGVLQRMLASSELGTRVLVLGIALATAVLIAAPWYALMEYRHPGYVHYYFVQRHVMGFVSEAQRHGGSPWWYYLPLLALGGLPWIAYLPVGMRQAWTQRRAGWESGNEARLWCWCWLLSGVLFLSIARVKLLTYMLPLFPAVAMLGADVWTQWFDDRLNAQARQWLVAIWRATSFAAPAMLPVGIAGVQLAYGIVIPVGTWCGIVLLSLIGMLPAWRWRRGPSLEALATAGAVLGLYMLVLTGTVVPQVAARTTGRDLAELLAEQSEGPPRVIFLENRVGSVAFYLPRKLRAGLQRDDFQEMKVQRYVAERTPRPDLLLVVPEDELDDVGEHLPV